MACSEFSKRPQRSRTLCCIRLRAAARTSQPWSETLPRPKLEQRVRDAVRSYLLAAETLCAAEAPLNTLAVARRVGFNRKTLKKYGLDAEIARASEKQERNGKISARKSEWRSYADTLHERDCE